MFLRALNTKTNLIQFNWFCTSICSYMAANVCTKKRFNYLSFFNPKLTKPQFWLGKIRSD